MRKKKLILFDIDGVLLLSTDKSITLLCKIIEQAGLEVNTKLIFDNWGHLFAQVLIPMLAEADNWPDFKKELVLEKTTEYFKTISFHSPAGLSDKLKSLILTGYKLGVVTNRDNDMLKRAFVDAGLDFDLFEVVKTSDDGIYKPDPRVFDEALESFKAEEIIFVGDSMICDLPAAYNHQQKIDFVGITSAVHKREHFRLAGVPNRFIYDSVLEFIDDLLIPQTVAKVFQKSMRPGSFKKILPKS